MKLDWVHRCKRPEHAEGIEIVFGDSLDDPELIDYGIPGAEDSNKPSEILSLGIYFCPFCGKDLR
jgi:hypothetical protein